MTPEIVEVHWIDAYVSTSGITLKKAATRKPVETITVGFLVSENDDGITIAMDRWPKTPKEFKAYTFIPWGMVTEVYIYGEP